jgi:hypothetical protein
MRLAGVLQGRDWTSWPVDLAVVETFESGILDVHDFLTGDDYRCRFEAEANQRFDDFIRARFNSGVAYRSHNMKWDTSIEQKVLELGRFLSEKSPKSETGQNSIRS